MSQQPTKSNEFFSNYHIPQGVLNDNTLINFYELQNEYEIMELMDIAYETADKISPTGTRTPIDIKIIEQKRKELEDELRVRQQEEKEDEQHRQNWQNWAEHERKKTELSLKKEKLEQMTRLQKALENPKIKDLLLKVMNHELTPEKAFSTITKNSKLKEQMMTLTSTHGRGGKSRIFRRKNTKMTSKSIRTARMARTARSTRRTRRHRNSSTRRSRRK